MVIVLFFNEKKEFFYFSLRIRLFIFYLLIFVFLVCEDDILIGIVSIMVFYWI